MNRNNLLRKTALAREVAFALAVFASSATLQSNALAQSNAAGNVFGHIEQGAIARIESTATGAKRILTPDATGRVAATALPPGDYSVQLIKDGKVLRTMQIEVLLGQGTEINFGPTSQLAAVEVVGHRRAIDVSSSNSNTTFTARQLDQLPIAKDLGAIIQLAPQTTRGDSRYPDGAASFGGASVSENAYYINGFPVTNPLSQLGSSQLPYGAIAQAQLYTGGFGAEFGRSNGGVVNLVTKSGGNRWEAGVAYSLEPNSLRATRKDLTYGVTGDPANAATDGSLYRARSLDNKSRTRVSVNLGGPLIEDKLFMFVAAEKTDTDFSGVNLGLNRNSPASSNDKWGWSDRKDSTTRWLGKFDWNLTDSQRLELTLIGDRSTRREDLSGYNYNTGARDGVVKFTGNYLNALGTTPQGMDDKIFKYTLNATDDLTISALWGEGVLPRENTFSGSGGVTANSHTVTLFTPSAAAPGISYNSLQALNGNQEAASGEDRVKTKRIDVDWRVGQHTLRAGVDDNELISMGIGRYAAGNGAYSYRFNANTGFVPNASTMSIGQGGGLGALGYYGRESIFETRANAMSNQQGWYVEDQYQATKDLLLTVGLRSESFQNKNDLGETYLEQKNVLVPRLGATWNVNGDGSFKVFGTAGRYNVQLPTALAARGATPSTTTNQYFTYTGVAADGTPIGRTNLGTPFSGNGEYGQRKVAQLLTATDLKPNQQDELIIGFERAISPSMVVGAKVTHREMVAFIDDFCDAATLYGNYAAAHGIALGDDFGTYSQTSSTPACIYFNPGRSNTFKVDFAGNGNPADYRDVTFSAEDMGFGANGAIAPAKRTYTAVDLFVEHPFSNGWYGKLNYTWSRSYGNAEGQTNSDTGQLDVGETAAWDFGALAEHAQGLLPSNRTHQLKAYGFMELTPEWGVGANFLLATGRPKSCIGQHPDPAVRAYGYQSSFHYCNGVAAPRGDLGSLPTESRLDLNFQYKPQAAKGLILKVDVFNVFNQQVAETIEESREDAGWQAPVSSLYDRVISYTAPRSVKLSVEYSHKF